MAGGPQQVSLVETTLSGVCICSHLPPSLAPSASCPHQGTGASALLIVRSRDGPASPSGVGLMCKILPSLVGLPLDAPQGGET